MTIFTGVFAKDDMAAGPSAAEGAGKAKPDDAQLYLRHVERGESIRSLARELGCHASTVLRRIRRYEERREDSLVDGALSPRARPAFDERQAMRVLRRLAEPGAMLVTTENMEKAIVTREDIRTAILQRDLAEMMALKGWLVQSGPQGRLQRYVIAPAGRSALRGMLRSPRQRNAVPGPDDFADARPIGNPASDEGAPDPDAGNPHAARHRIWGTRDVSDPEDGRRRRRRVNLAESPLLVLARRRDGNGQPFLPPGLVAAGERLREDFELAQMGPRVTQNWDGFMTAGIDVSRSNAGYRGGSESARDRVAAALRDLGPGMGDIVLRVCCFLEGIEMTERRLGWSARSGKIVLRLALMRLERHYRETYGAGSPLIG